MDEHSADRTYIVLTSTTGPLRKTIHRGAMIRADGAVSAACFKRPHPVDLARASWTIRNEAVTCARCRRLLR
jgi:hypothetical protein